MTEDEFLATLGLTVDHVDEDGDRDIDGHAYTIDGDRYFDWSSGWDRDAGFIEAGDGETTAQIDMSPHEMVMLFANLGVWVIRNVGMGSNTRP